eukprot:CAMPEP_0181213026 /NCGR_PEP_ID=MMETSP1096-20121128/24678_1 /TAXON_ID=156174 ORGANISM="Chrysochromulina ericina, Strain CCMP281" /NCGR_SAMPLE_ID=MMETSP1096 /ASSEMBLY_ACC=CAM_ASM_000453 /LENGTH=123 /DNA_ID=CAMNT_0023304623 /DNA_START=259 /DNA_END=631 /DNA_ORIENTATION=-
MAFGPALPGSPTTASVPCIRFRDACCSMLCLWAPLSAHSKCKRNENGCGVASAIALMSAPPRCDVSENSGSPGTPVPPPLSASLASPPATVAGSSVRAQAQSLLLDDACDSPPWQIYATSSDR